MNIRDLTNKVANNGANVNGKLTAEEYNVLITQVKNMSNGAVYMGVATPTTTPQTFDGNVELVYLATTAGKYTAFGNIVVNNDEICALRWRYSVGWGKEVIATNDYTTEEKAKVAKIEGKQDTLTLTVKDNGNIVLGNIAGQTKEFMPATPSGDPMHYAYIDAGATWSSSTGYWSLNGLTDITSEQMRKIYNVGFLRQLVQGPLSGERAAIRTNLLRIGVDNYVSGDDLIFLAYKNRTIEVINLKNTTGTYEPSIPATRFLQSFYDCKALREIYGELDTNGVWTDAFYNCTSLQRVRVRNLNNNLDWSYSPLINKDSVVFAISKAKPTNAISIKLNAEAYARWANDADVLAALAAQPLITLISA